MVITIIRSGGFTGIPFKKTIDTSKLPAEKAREIEEKIQLSIINNKSSIKKSSPDRFTYTISLQDSEIHQTIEISEESIDPKLKELIES